MQEEHRFEAFHMTKFIQTADGFISERYIVKISIRPHGLPDCYITYQDRSTHFEQTTATPEAVDLFLKAARRPLRSQ